MNLIDNSPAERLQRICEANGKLLEEAPGINKSDLDNNKYIRWEQAVSIQK